MVVDDQSASCDDGVIPLNVSPESLLSTEQDTFVDRTVTLSNQTDVDSQLHSTDYITLRNEQITDPSLIKYLVMARFPMAYALTIISAKKICDCLIQCFSISLCLLSSIVIWEPDSQVI